MIALPDPAALDVVPVEQLPAVLAQLAALQAAVAARLAGVERQAEAVARDRVGEDDELLDDLAVSRLLGVPASHVADLRRRGELPEVRVGGKYVRVRRGDVREYVRRHRASLP